MKFSFVRLFTAAAIILGITITMASCGTQKMGCPGSITKTEAQTEGQS